MSDNQSARVSAVDYDVVIAGAGISGISYAYRLKQMLPSLSYIIIEARHEIGGTWSLFKYPGIRIDTDLFTYSFTWKPWTEDLTIAEGSLIQEYLHEAVEEQGIAPHIRFHHRMDAMSWSSMTNTWTLDVTVDNKTQCQLRSRFVCLGSGHYDADEPLNSTIPGIDQFQGPIIHPQFWPDNFSYADKNVVVIGSGATAVSLVPSLADKAAHVTMLQRSPTWIVPIQYRSSVMSSFLLRWMPSWIVAAFMRLGWNIIMTLSKAFCFQCPALARKVLFFVIQRQLAEGTSLAPDFVPAHDPMTQRACATPDADFYQALRAGKASVKTGRIERVTERSIRLVSGEELQPDIIVTATGLRLAMGGKARIIVDGVRRQIADSYSWKSAMLEGLPNLFYTMGYFDASWSQGVDISAQLACRMIRQLRREEKEVLIPTMTEEEKGRVKDRPFVYLTSTYVKVGQKNLPKVCDAKQWSPRSYYFKDAMSAWWGDIRSGIELR